METQPTALEYFALLTVLALSCVGGTMGFRILRNALRAGGVEKWVGYSLLLVCAGGYVPIVIAQLVGHPEVRFALVAIGIGAAHAGVLCTFVFTRRVFRPDVAWLRVAVWVMGAAMAAVWLSGLIYVNWPLRSAPPREAIVAGFPWALASNVLCGLGMAWSAWEAIRQWSLSSKRARIGLADPLVANRMLLWGIFTGASFLTSVMHGAMVASGRDPGESGLVIAVSGVIALASTASLWLAFLPPEAWVRRIRGASAAS